MKYKNILFWPNIAWMPPPPPQLLDSYMIVGKVGVMRTNVLFSCTPLHLFLFQRSSRYISDWHITLHGRAIRSVISAKFLGITFDTTLSFTKHLHVITNLARHRFLKLLCISTSTHGPSPSTTIRLFNTYIRTLLEYGSAATCVANPSRFVQWERLQMRLITKTLDLPNTLNHDILKRHADQPTIHDRLLYLAKRWHSKAYENNAAHRESTTTPVTMQENDDEYPTKY